MPKDAILGLLAGVMGVVLIAVVYYQKAGTPPPGPTPHTAPGKPLPNYPTPAATPAEPAR
jgi:hypothetical protein